MKDVKARLSEEAAYEGLRRQTEENRGSGKGLQR